MNRLRVFLSRVWGLIRPRELDRDLRDQINTHLEEATDEYVQRGLSPTEARRAAHLSFGGVAQAEETSRDVRGRWLDDLAKDLRYGLRTLRRNPAFATVAVLSLAIGIGANTAVFSLLDRILWRPLPVSHPEQLVIARWGASKDLGDLSFSWASGGGDGHGGWMRNVFSWPAFADLRARNQALNDVLGFSPLGQLNDETLGQGFTTGGMLVSGNFGLSFNLVFSFVFRLRFLVRTAFP